MRHQIVTASLGLTLAHRADSKRRPLLETIPSLSNDLDIVTRTILQRYTVPFD